MLSIKNNKNISFSCGRISSCFSENLEASMTVEAGFVLPFFLFAFLNIISIIEIYRLQGNMSAAIHDTVKHMSLLSYEYKEIRQEMPQMLESLGLTYLYGANKVKNELGADYLNNSPIKGGASSVIWVKSNVMDEDECIDLVAEYCVKPPVSMIGYNEAIMYNRLRTRAWTGYDNAGSESGSDSNNEMVYVTVDGEVYHNSRSCSYLKLSISAIDIDSVGKSRNQNGEKYYPCEECAKYSSGTVYITDYGNRYHTMLSCSKLKRTVMQIPASQNETKHACSKCGEK